MTHEAAKAYLERRFVDGKLNVLEEKALRKHLQNCTSCRAAYDRYAEAEAILEGTLDQPPRAQVEREAARQPWLTGSTKRNGAFAFAGIIAAAAVLVLGLALWNQQPPPDDGFTRRGGAGGAGAWIRVFVKNQQVITPAKDNVPRGAGLLFSYSVERTAKVRHLAIVARDAAGHIHWFHPGYVDAEAAPKSIAIKAGVADLELPETVFVDLAPGAVEICGLFTVEPLDIKAVDRRLEAGQPWPRATRHCLEFEVTR